MPTGYIHIYIFRDRSSSSFHVDLEVVLFFTCQRAFSLFHSVLSIEGEPYFSKFFSSLIYLYVRTHHEHVVVERLYRKHSPSAQHKAVGQASTCVPTIDRATTQASKQNWRKPACRPFVLTTRCVLQTDEDIMKICIVSRTSMAYIKTYIFNIFY